MGAQPQPKPQPARRARAARARTVSQICSLMFLSSILTMRAPNSTPMVRSCTCWKRLSVNCSSRHDLPTPVSPAAGRRAQRRGERGARSVGGRRRRRAEARKRGCSSQSRPRSSAPMIMYLKLRRRARAERRQRASERARSAAPHCTRRARRGAAHAQVVVRGHLSALPPGNRARAGAGCNGSEGSRVGEGNSWRGEESAEFLFDGTRFQAAASLRTTLIRASRGKKQ